MNQTTSKAWIQTYTRKAFDVLNPDPELICIEDIAHALSNQCRFTGHTREFYSAIFGHANNASVAWSEEYLAQVIFAAAELTFAKWEECGAVLSEIIETILAGYHEARASQKGTHAPDLA